MPERSSQFSPQGYRRYLQYLAQTQPLNEFRGKVDPSDIVQETMLQAHAARDQFAGESAAEYRAWLRQIVLRVTMDVLRRFRTQKRDPRLELSLQAAIDDSDRLLETIALAVGSTPSRKLAQQESLDQLLKAVLSLPKDQKQALVCRYLRGMTVTETAVEMDRSVPSVAGLLRRAVADLRQSLGHADDMGDPVR